MNDRDRLIDARADQNLADVTRVPAPWEPTSTNEQNHAPPDPTSAQGQTNGKETSNGSNGVGAILYHMRSASSARSPPISPTSVVRPN